MGKMDTAPTVVQPADPKPYLYGWFKFTPNFLQGLNKARWFLLFMCLANIFQSMTINGLVGVVLSSLETRFGLQSSQSSWIASAYDVSTVPILAIISYFGSRSHRPRWTAMGLFILVLGTTIFVLPHFTTPAYRPAVGSTSEDMSLCTSNKTAGGDGGSQGNSLVGYLAVFIIGRVLHGLGAVPLYTIAVTYLDDCVSKESFSLYIALFYAAGVLGPALGYIVGGYLLTVYTDFYQVDTGKLNINSSSTQWVGAWWVGFLAGAIALFLITIPMSGYPRDLPGAEEIRSKKVSEAHNAADNDGSAGDGEINVGWRELPSYFKDLAMNPTYVFLTLMVCCDSFLTGGFTAFGPKYVQEQFSITAALSGMMFGIVVIPGGAGGTIAGGIIVKKLGLKCAGIMKAEMIFSISIMVTGFMFFIVCEPLKFAGVTSGYNGTEAPDRANFSATCNQACVCDDVGFSPVCSHDNIQYFSACHAGCESVKDKKEYFNCSCIAGDASILGKPPATSKPCTVEGCNLAPLFMVIFFCAMFCLFACSSMNISATIRCLPATHRSLGIGVQWIFLRLLGTVPGPLVFGAAFDRACTLFARDANDKKGQCLFYDKQLMALLLFAICVGIKLLSLAFIVLAWKLYKPPADSDAAEPQTDKTQRRQMANGVGVTNTAFESDIQQGPALNKTVTDQTLQANTHL